MTGYVRAPQKVVLKCDEPGCKWMTIKFRDGSILDPQYRALLARAAHKRWKHERKSQ